MAERHLNKKGTMHKLAQVVRIGGYTIENPPGFAFGNGGIGAIISEALKYIFAFAGIGLLMMIISSGFAMMMSSGDAKKLEGAKSRLTNAIIGFLIIFASFWIVQLAGRILGWDSLSNF